MAKDKVGVIGSLDSGPQALKTIIADAVKQVIVELPLGSPNSEGYETDLATSGRVQFDQGPRHLQLQMKPEEAQMFLRLRDGLRSSNAKLDDGRPVWTNADVMRWLLLAISKAEE